MISLLITFFLSFFCCSSVPIYTLDNNKEVEIRDYEPKNIVAGSTNAIFTNADFSSTEFLVWLIFGQKERGGEYQNINYDVLTDYSIELDSDGHILNLNGLDISGEYTQVTKLVLNKEYQGIHLDSNNDSYYQFYYGLEFYTFSDTLVMSYDYLVYFYNTGLVLPFVFSRNDDMRLWYTISYYEDVNFGDTPLLNFVVPYIHYDFSNDPNYDFNLGYSRGYSDGYNDGLGSGYQSGYNQGLIDGASYDDTALTIFTGIIDVGLLPINIFLSILNFDLFGVNVAGFVSALLTVSLVIIIIRIIVGSKNG